MSTLTLFFIFITLIIIKPSSTTTTPNNNLPTSIVPVIVPVSILPPWTFNKHFTLWYRLLDSFNSFIPIMASVLNLGNALAHNSAMQLLKLPSTAYHQHVNVGQPRFNQNFVTPAKLAFAFLFKTLFICQPWYSPVYSTSLHDQSIFYVHREKIDSFALTILFVSKRQKQHNQHPSYAAISVLQLSRYLNGKST